MKTKILATIVLCAVTASAWGQELNIPKLMAQAREEYRQPVRPGIPGKQPFWNKYSERFMYAPAFDFPEIAGAARYRFTLVSEADKSVRRFEAPVPWAPLSPVWLDVPVGYAYVVVEALDKKGRPFATAGRRRFYRAATWDGRIPEAACSYIESARRGLRFLFRERHVQHWLKTGQPDPHYDLYCYPSKIMGALIQAMVRYSKLAPPDEARDALSIARKVTDFLISISYGKDAAYPFFPPTYRGRARAAKHYSGQIMIFYPTRPANAYLDLYEATGDKKYFQAAIRIADTYLKTQLPNGTWLVKVDARTGKAVTPNLCIPIRIVNLFDRLIQHYGLKQYEAARDKAWRWIMGNPVKTFNWEGHFEDVQPRPPYKNLSHIQADRVARYIFTHFKNDPHMIATAEEIARFSEDQFVVWDKPRPDPRHRRDRGFVPSVYEQYVFHVPIDGSVAHMIMLWHDAYQATGKALYLAKMRALANEMTRVQDAKTGMYPTYWWRPISRSYWLNCAAVDAMAMLKVAALSPK